MFTSSILHNVLVTSKNVFISSALNLLQFHVSVKEATALLTSKQALLSYSGNQEFGRLTENEDRCEGSISLSVYVGYARACGLLAVALTVFFFADMQLTKMASDFWLSAWSHFNRKSTAELSKDAIERKNWEYLFYYAGLLLTNVAFAFVANLVAQLTTVAATKPLHDRMLKRYQSKQESYALTKAEMISDFT